MFLPITTVARVGSLDEAMRRANEVNYGLTAGFYGSEEEAQWFFENIRAGVTYANRPQGATTGAWPASSRSAGGKALPDRQERRRHYYLPLYMHEQIHTLSSNAHRKVRLGQFFLFIGLIY
jgi:1-pyrroline-5-carboxylate dehydrogenase